MKVLYDMGYAPVDIIGTVFRVVKNFPASKMAEWTQLQFIKEIGAATSTLFSCHSHFSQLISTASRAVWHTLLANVTPSWTPSLDAGWCLQSDAVSDPTSAGTTHMRILEGHTTLIQLTGLVARLCKPASILF